MLSSLYVDRMSFYRALSKSLLRGMAAERAVVPWCFQHGYHGKDPAKIASQVPRAADCQPLCEVLSGEACLPHP